MSKRADLVAELLTQPFVVGDRVWSTDTVTHLTGTIVAVDDSPTPAHQRIVTVLWDGLAAPTRYGEPYAVRWWRLLEKEVP